MLTMNPKEKDGRQYLLVHLKDSDQFLKDYANTIREKLKAGLVVVLNEQGEKIAYVAAMSQEWVKAGYNAGNLVKFISAQCNGRGGGRPDMAQGGGENTNPNELLEKIENYILNQEV